MVLKNSRRRLLCGLALVGALAAAGGAQASDPALKRCIATQAQAMDFSGVVLLALGGDVTTYARGVRAGPGSPAMALDTQFDLASAGKMFTGAAVAQLVEQGKVGLDDPIGRYVKGLTPEASAATVSQLLSHRSGLGDFIGPLTPEDFRRMWADRRLSDFVGLVAQDKPAFAPGTKYQYSNTGFLLLGMLVESVSGVTYDAYLQRHVFGPAGMHATTAVPASGFAYAAPMTRYTAEQLAGPPPAPGQAPPLSSPDAPLRRLDVADGPPGASAGGYFSTAGDMHRFLVALTNGTLVRPETLHEMLKPWSVMRPAGGGKPEVDYGFGIGVTSVAGHRSIGHPGGAQGINTAADFFPDDSAAAIVLANRDPPLAQTLYAKLAPTLFDPAELKRCIGG
jgi:CubicO group peptidase (beta-lactamase class C family)